MNSTSMPLTTSIFLPNGDGLEPRQRFGGILFGVERQRRVMLAEAALVRELRVLFLQVRGVGQHQLAQVGRAAGAVHRALEALRDEPRQPAGVIDVRVRQDDGVDRLGRDRQRRPVALPQLLQALEQSAVEQDALAIDLEQMLGAGHRAGGSEKRQRGHASYDRWLDHARDCNSRHRLSLSAARGRRGPVRTPRDAAPTASPRANRSSSTARPMKRPGRRRSRPRISCSAIPTTARRRPRGPRCASCSIAIASSSA